MQWAQVYVLNPSALLPSLFSWEHAMERSWRPVWKWMSRLWRKFSPWHKTCRFALFISIASHPTWQAVPASTWLWRRPQILPATSSLSAVLISRLFSAIAEVWETRTAQSSQETSTTLNCAFSRNRMSSVVPVLPCLRDTERTTKSSASTSRWWEVSLPRRRRRLCIRFPRWVLQ